MKQFGNYSTLVNHHYSDSVDSNVRLPEELVYDKYMKNQAEQISYLIRMYQAEPENAKVYYDIFIGYLDYDANEYMTFAHKDSRFDGSFLLAMGMIVRDVLLDDMKIYNPEYYLSNAYVEQRDELTEAIHAYANEMQN